MWSPAARGFATRLITIPLIVNFCVAYLTASREVLLNVFNDPDAFVSDADFLFLPASMIVLIFGPGAFSVDAVLKKLFTTPRGKAKACRPCVKGKFRKGNHAPLKVNRTPCALRLAGHFATLRALPTKNLP